MDAGHWTIYWNHHEPEEIPVQRDEIGVSNPSCKHRDGTLTFSWHDGRLWIIPLNSINSAEYTPAKEN